MARFGRHLLFPDELYPLGSDTTLVATFIRISSRVHQNGSPVTGWQNIPSQCVKLTNVSLYGISSLHVQEGNHLHVFSFGLTPGKPFPWPE